jgi:uncharacterized nucleotidyltransferase DUF6036
MRQKVTATRLEEFMKALGSGVTEAARVYLVGGASSVLLGWRDSTIDIDLKLVPESDEILRRLPSLKDRLQINIELASPDDFIPPLPGWEERSRFIQQVGRLTFLHYDFYAQALAKIERGHGKDLQDVRDLIKSNLIEPERLLELFSRIEDLLHRYPALDVSSFRQSVESVVESSQDK